MIKEFKEFCKENAIKFIGAKGNVCVGSTIRKTRYGKLNTSECESKRYIFHVFEYKGNGDWQSFGIISTINQKIAIVGEVVPEDDFFDSIEFVNDLYR
jgi:hypothetical protein